MKNILAKLSLPAVLLTLSLGTLVAMPALADNGGDGTNTTSVESNTDSSTSSNTDSSESGSGKDTQESSDSTAETEKPDSTAMHEHETEFRQQGDELIAALQHEKKGKHTAAQREAFCAANKQGMLTKFASIDSELASFQLRVDGILSKVEAYQTTNNITVTNWTALLAAATNAQSASAASIGALKAVTPTAIDCTSSTIATEVATFTQGAKTARTNLQAYKTAVKALIEALLQAKNTSGGSNQ